MKPRDARQHEQMEQPTAVQLVLRRVAMRFASASLFSGPPNRSSGSTCVSEAESAANEAEGSRGKGSQTTEAD